MNYLNKIINWGLCLFVFLLPWQTRWIFKDAIINGSVWEYGRYSLYGTEILLIVLIILGIILAMRRHPEDAVRRLKDPIALTIVAFIIFAALSITRSADKTLALYVWLKLIEGIGLFWLIVKSEKRHLLKLSLIAAGLVQGLLAIYQFFTQSTFASKWLGSALIQSIDQGASVVQFLDQRWLRAYGSFPHPNVLGGFLATVLLLIIISLWQLNQRINESRNQEIKRLDYGLNIFYWFSAGVVFLGLVFSFSRGACLGFVLGFIYLIIYAFKKKLRTERLVSIKLAIFFLALTGFVLLNFPYQLFTTRITAQSRLEQKSLIERQNAAGDAWAMFKAHPVLGVGLGNYTKVLQNKDANKPGLPAKASAKAGWAYQPVHNLFQLILSELGLIGLLLFIFLFVNLFRSVAAVNYAFLLAMVFMALFDHYFWSLYFGVMWWWLVWGLAYNSKIKKEPLLR
ncbi:MAG: O-antigen ligase family protein [Candidatus Komeilibacteria bacterium]|nr:O-antigen ligase family protein [Candidatus Komeilibacteria bacterium]